MRGRRPIEPHEEPYLAALGAEIRALRLAARPTVEEQMLRRVDARAPIRNEGVLRQAELARRAEVSAGFVSDLERGRWRTRRSTLERIVRALVDEELVAEVLDGLVAAAGPALAPESQHFERVTRRRQARAAQERARTRSILRSVERQARQMRGDTGERLRELTKGMREQLDRLDEEAGRTPPPPPPPDVPPEILELIAVREVTPAQMRRMSPTQLLEHFDRVQAAEEAVAALPPRNVAERPSRAIVRAHSAPDEGPRSEESRP